MSFLTARSVGKRFEREGRQVRAIDDFSLSVQEGEFVSIVGPSGCGKSTFLHMVGGFEPITEGSISLDGQPITGAGPDRGMLFQDYALFPWRSVIGNVAWSLEVQGQPKAQRLATAQKYLELVGLSAFRDAYPSELSGGMQQRIALARVLAFEPRMLLMDEPFGALDEITRNRLDAELLDLWRGKKLTVIFVTHSIYEAVYLSNRVIVMAARPGRIVEEVRIDEPYPRGPDFRVSTAFSQYAKHLQDSLLRASGTLEDEALA